MPNLDNLIERVLKMAEDRHAALGINRYYGGATSNASRLEDFKKDMARREFALNERKQSDLMSNNTAERKKAIQIADLQYGLGGSTDRTNESKLKGQMYDSDTQKDIANIQRGPDTPTSKDILAAAIKAYDNVNKGLLPGQPGVPWDVFYKKFTTSVTPKPAPPVPLDISDKTFSGHTAASNKAISPVASVPNITQSTRTQSTQAPWLNVDKWAKKIFTPVPNPQNDIDTPSLAEQSIANRAAQTANKGLGFEYRYKVPSNTVGPTYSYPNLENDIPAAIDVRRKRRSMFNTASTRG